MIFGYRLYNMLYVIPLTTKTNVNVCVFSNMFNIQFFDGLKSNSNLLAISCHKTKYQDESKHL